MRSTHLIYTLAVTTALALGLGAAFWRTAVENGRLIETNHATEMARLTAQDELKALRDKLRREISGREFAEAAQTIAENSQRATRDRLIRETKARQASEAEAQASNERLAQETKARLAAEANYEKAEFALKSQSIKLGEVAFAKRMILYELIY